MTKIRSALAGVLVLALLALAAGVAYAAAPPFEPDPNSNGSLTFYDAGGQVITTGSTNDAPFAAFVQASAPGHASGDNKATLFGALPKNGVATGAWSSEAISGSTVYPNASAPGALGTSSLPLVTLTAADGSLATLAGDLPNTAPSGDPYAGLYQLRVKTSGPGQSAGATYASADILISGTTWSLVYPEPVATATSTALGVTPTGPQYAGTTLTFTATITPAAAGSVQFKDGTGNVGAPVAVSGGSAQYATNALGVGSHNLSAVFTPANPASNPTLYAGSTSPTVTYQVNTSPATATNTALSVDPGTSTAYANVTFTATITPSNAPGTVSFTDSGVPVGTTPTGQGTFSFVTNALGEGAHTITATFNPSNTATFAPSSATASAFTLGAPQYAPASANVRATIDPGTLSISTPYTDSSPLDLGNLVLNDSATLFSISAPITGITIADTRAGNLPWTVSAQATDLTNGSGGTIDSQNLGLTGLVADPVAGNALTAASVTPSANAAASPPVAPGATGSGGLGGGVSHTVLHADHGAGSIGYHGLLTLTAPTSSPPGTYVGILTLTIG